MPKTGRLEYEKRVFAVQGWIIEGIQTALIIRQIISANWCTSQRQAERMLKAARDKWVKVPEAELTVKRKLKVLELQQLKRSLLGKYKGTPSGIFALMQIEKEIIKLEGLEMPKEHLLKGDTENPIKHLHAVRVEVVQTNIPIAESEEEIIS